MIIDAGRQTGIEYSDGGLVTFAYDAAANRTRMEDGTGITTFAYDELRRLKTVTNPGNKILTYSYDTNGNTQVENAGGSLTTYTWSAENMCVGIALPSGALNTFAYDADLKRRQAEDSAGLAKFINDLENVLLETDAGGTTLVVYTLEPMQYGNLISQRRGGASAWHHFDALGSTERLTDSDQAALATYLNTAFGVPVVATGNHPNRLRFGGRVGYRLEPDTQQYDVRRRRLGPALGRFLSCDPLDALTRQYVYGDNSPLHLVDPTGLDCVLWEGPTVSGVKPAFRFTPTKTTGGLYKAGAARNIRVQAKLCCTDRASAEQYSWFQWINARSTLGGRPYPRASTPDGRDWCADEPDTYETCNGDPGFISRTRPFGGPARQTEACNAGKGRCELYRLWVFDPPGISAAAQSYDRRFYVGYYNFVEQRTFRREHFPCGFLASFKTGIGPTREQALRHVIYWGVTARLQLTPTPAATYYGP